MPLDLQPTLTGDLLTLRPITADDFADLYAVASDPLLWEQHPASNRYEEGVFRQFFDDAIASGGALVAVDRSDSRVIGASRYHAYDAERREVEIGWSFIARSHWGGPYNAEMKRLMLAHAFQHVDRVVFHVGVNNMRSRRAVEKIGGVETGIHHDPSGRVSVVYEIRSAP